MKNKTDNPLKLTKKSPQKTGETTEKPFTLPRTETGKGIHPDINFRMFLEPDTPEEAVRDWTLKLREFIGENRKNFLSKSEGLDAGTLSKILSGKLPKKATTLLPLINSVKRFRNLTPFRLYLWVQDLELIYSADGYRKLMNELKLKNSGFRMDTPPDVTMSSATGQPWSKLEYVASHLATENSYAHIIYGPRRSGKTEFIKRAVIATEPYYPNGVFWLDGQYKNIEQTLVKLIEATPEIQMKGEASVKVMSALWKEWAYGLPHETLVVLDDVSDDVLGFFSAIQTNFVKFLVATTDQDKALKLFPSFATPYKVAAIDCLAVAISRSGFHEYIKFLPTENRDWMLQVAEMCDYYPDVISKARNHLGKTRGYENLISGLYKSFPAAKLGFHLTARKILAALNQSEKRWLLNLSCAAKPEQFLSIEEIAKIWGMQIDPARFVLERLLSLALIRESNINRETYRPLRILVEACDIARKFNREPEEFLLASDDLF
jgi:hypothetical protein